MLGLPSLNVKTLHPLGGSRIELDAFQVDCGHQPQPGRAIGFPMFSSGFLNPQAILACLFMQNNGVQQQL